jgi:hypothetical protein
VGIRERKLLPPPPSHFQANEAEFGTGIAAGAQSAVKRQKTAAPAAVKKPGAMRSVALCAWLIT